MVHTKMKQLLYVLHDLAMQTWFKGDFKYILSCLWRVSSITSNLNTLTPEQKHRQATRPQNKEKSQLKYFWYAHGSVLTQVHPMDGRTSHAFALQNYHATRNYHTHVTRITKNGHRRYRVSNWRDESNTQILLKIKETQIVIDRKTTKYSRLCS